MKKFVLVLAVTGLVILAAASQDTDVNVSVSESCQVSLYDFEQPGIGTQDHKVIGTNGTGYFSGTLANQGNHDADVAFNLSVTSHENRTLDMPENDTEYVIPPDDNQPANYSFDTELSTETSIETDEDGNETITGRFEDFMLEFWADYPSGNYTGRADIDYNCGNESGTVKENRTFEVILVDGDGVIPDDVGEDDDVDLDVDVDAEEEELNDTAEIDTDANESDLEDDAELDADADETDDDAEPRPGDSPDPGETEVPQPDPSPSPVPMISVSMQPLNTTYEAPRGRFTEVGMEIENVGEEDIDGMNLEPRFDNEDWESQDADIESLEVNESLEREVYVNPSEDVSPGMYQIPVYASIDEEDVAIEHINVDVTQDIFVGSLAIQESPRNLAFEMNQSRNIPILLENMGEEDLNDVTVELQNSEDCGEYEAETLETLSPEEQVSVDIGFDATDEVTECESTVIVSSEEGEFTFADLDIDVREEIGVVPEEFRVPIVASLWTVLLLIYALMTKKYGIHNMTVKVPLVLLVVGEAFIIIYLASAYYGAMPPGLLPFG